MPHILVVDDDSGVRSLVAQILSSLGYEVSAAKGGEEALEMLDRQMPDLILSDIRMPGLDGVGLFREVRLRDSQLPFVAMSGHLMNCEGAGPSFDGFVMKPFRIQALCDAIDRALEARMVA